MRVLARRCSYCRRNLCSTLGSWQLPPGTKVRVTAESQLEDGTRRAKVWHYDADGQIKRGWVSWIGKDNRQMLSEAVSPPTTPFGSKNTTPANSPPSMRPPSRRNGSSPYSSPTTSPPSMRPPSRRPDTNSPPSMRPLSASPSSLRKGGGSAIDGIKEEGEEERSSSNLSYRSGWSLQSEELRQKLLLASLNSPRSYRSEDTLPPEVALSGSVATGQKLPVTASFKNRSDRRLHRLTHAINSAKDEIAAAESFSHAQAATPHNRRRSREAEPESFSHPLPDQKQRQHVMRLRVWRSMKLPLHKVNKRTLDVHYNILNDSFSKRMGALEA